jgi:hypothetical protein
MSELYSEETISRVARGQKYDMISSKLVQARESKRVRWRARDRRMRFGVSPCPW